ncbi:hemerythrin domain-containing protein [Nonomuraea recticatena]|uniref:Hemerythrin-like domain-containing protein n=1 Tax=Nonomuraea recticatena TaxID=46178 RepID=A0ABP6DFW3_9ACTN
MTYRLDMTMMFAVHDALRRDVERVAKLTARLDDDPRRLLGAALGWELFKGYLRVHHTTEDDMLWPVMERTLAGRPDELALLVAMEAEHALIDPLLASFDEALADPDTGHERLGDLADSLATVLGGHLSHEEREALAVIDLSVSEEEWQRFGQEHGKRIGADAQRYLPWVLDEASEERVSFILGHMPEHIRKAYREEWRAAYVALNTWGA